MSLKPFARLLNFILFLVLISAGLSRVSHAATLSNSNNSTIATTAEDVVSTTTASNDHSDASKSLASNSQVAMDGTKTTTLTQDSIGTDKNTDNQIVMKDGAVQENLPKDISDITSDTETNQQIADSDKAASLPVIKDPFNTTKSTNTNAPIVHHITTLSTPITHPTAPSVPSPSPATPINSHDTGILNSSLTINSSNVTKSFLDRFYAAFQQTLTQSHQYPSLPVASLLIVIMVASIIMIWASKGYGFVMAPRGQTNNSNSLWLVFTERYEIWHSALFHKLTLENIVV